MRSKGSVRCIRGSAGNASVERFRDPIAGARKHEGKGFSAGVMLPIRPRLPGRAR
jgi:hypothetical protein